MYVPIYPTSVDILLCNDKADRVIFYKDIPDHHTPGRPREPDFQTYLHRIGRTGRFGRIGVAISFVSNQEEWNMLRKIQQHFGCQIDRVDTGDWDEVEEVIKKTIKNSRAQANFAANQQ
jgi:ATP-dependent RNA helicase DDX19/DBP5